MSRELKAVLSIEPPKHPCLWLKPYMDGFTAYVFNRGYWQPLDIVDDNKTKKTSDDHPVGAEEIAQFVNSSVQNSIQDLIGDKSDPYTADTIRGAKKLTKEYVNRIMGSADDTSDSLTLIGLKKYIDENLGPNPDTPAVAAASI